MWKDLSMQQKSQMMNVGIKNGIYSLNKIRSMYDNMFANGGNLNLTSDNNLVTPDKSVVNTPKAVPLNPVKPTVDWERNLGSSTWDESNNTNELGGLSNIDKYRQNNSWFDVDDMTYRANKYGGHNVDRNAMMVLNNSIPANVAAYGGSLKGNNVYAQGGYIPSKSIKSRISRWEGSSMKTNNSFENEANAFSNAIPDNIRNRMSQGELDALYSYSYNVGANNFKERVVPHLINLYNGTGTVNDVQKSMYGTLDNKMEGLKNRRNSERQMFRDSFVMAHQRQPESNTPMQISPIDVGDFDTVQNNLQNNLQNQELKPLNTTIPSIYDMYTTLNSLLPQAHNMITAEDILNPST